MTDVCILGGGLVGGVLGIALAKQGLVVTIVDRENRETMLNPKIDGRTTAINLASKIIFDELGLWDEITPHAEPILDIKVFEGGSPWSIHFDHQMMGQDPMGYIVENRFIRQAIIQQTLSLSNITWYDETSLLTKKITPSGVEIFLDNGQEIKASLLVGAEGRSSPTREEAGIKSYQFSYDQKGLVFSVYHEKPHNGVAWEAFHPSGPMAFLPIQDCPTSGRHRSGVVWTLPVEQGDFWFSQENTLIAAKLRELFGFLGEFEIAGQKWIYPLNAQMVDRFIEERLVIVGDAAHVCHPVAGQGVNVGWRDAAILAKHLQHAKNLGVDLGASSILKEYQKARRFDTWSIFAMTDGMVRLFSNNSSILHFLRNAGLGTVNRIPTLKRFFMRRAMGFS
ncbi:UbiH/UbiF/VisC/COQ6 family ubiquinone biosynthesis hydroxylase [Candidatus Paracaedibacter symbiosus]|uniref:UbiH/UbiF/VisC/COQ6 family ubiquinone biosynthesis hydroxylase n=1 Tax=Candidatus Paracaedibacter symbiosus TaxID=244582 RepID=UPI000509B98E|nr:UbiH/UbiF/VisC/COQ6 family ubiquinone biosynthesis hydroxylase [Candidatus Paracaedibacter symbiosus]